MDVLSDVLESTHVRSVVTGRMELSAPWGLESDGNSNAMGFFVVTRGTFWIEMEGFAPMQVAGGDFLLVRKTAPHRMRDDPRTPTLPVSEVIAKYPNIARCQPGGVFQFGGGGAVTTLVGGRFEVEDASNSPLLAALPPVIHIKGDGGSTVQWLQSTLQFISAEMASGMPGAETVVNRLADILLVQAVRAHLAENTERCGWLKALVDPQISQALAAIHAQPDAPWTVESLAARVAMSRSAFAARFTDLVREPPLTYLTRWRMARATRLLRAGSATVAEVAAHVGYEAEAAFSKAFKRWTGQAPGAYRRERAAASA